MTTLNSFSNLSVPLVIFERRRKPKSIFNFKTKSFATALGFGFVVIAPLFVFRKQPTIISKVLKPAIQNQNSPSIFGDPNELNLEWFFGIPTAISWISSGWAIFKGASNVFKTISFYTGYLYAYGFALFAINFSNALLLKKTTAYTRDVVFKNPNLKVQPQKHWYFPETSHSLPEFSSKLEENILPNPLEIS